MASRHKRYTISNATWFIIGFALVITIVASFAFLVPKHDDSYNGFPFSKAKCPGSGRECWYSQFVMHNQPYTMTFYYYPRDVENIGVAYDSLKLPQLANISDHLLYITVPKDAPGNVAVAAIQLGRLLGTRYGLFNINVKAAQYGTGPDEISCANATGKIIILSFESSTIDAVTLRSKNCIVLSATSDERAIAVADAYSYRLLGIIRSTSNATLLR